MSDFGGTFHRGDRNFGNGYEMLLHIEALEAELRWVADQPETPPFMRLRIMYVLEGQGDE